MGLHLHQPEFDLAGRRTLIITTSRATLGEGGNATGAPPERTLHDPTPCRMLRLMSTEVTGVVHGNTITLDRTVPPLDGRVRIRDLPFRF